MMKKIQEDAELHAKHQAMLKKYSNTECMEKARIVAEAIRKQEQTET